jgi:thiamine-phosphate pyrophosphorylase
LTLVAGAAPLLISCAEDRHYRGEMKAQNQHDLPAALRVMVLTDRGLARGRTHEEIVRQALRGGATCVQLRDKQAGDGELLDSAGRIGDLCRRAGALYLVNDRLDVARLAAADGCHLGPNDLAVADARRIWPRPAILGFSAGSPPEALAAARAGADYLGVGPVFATATKPDAGAALGLEGLQAVVQATDLPVVAIGGITAENAAGCIDAGACGVAVAAAVVGAATVAPAARRLRRAVDEALAAGAGA